MVSIKQYSLHYDKPNSSPALFLVPHAAGIALGAMGKDLGEVVKEKVKAVDQWVGTNLERIHGLYSWKYSLSNIKCVM